MKRIIVLIAAAIATVASATAQENTTLELVNKAKAFEHLDVSVNIGTTGLGVEASSPIDELLGLRAGLSFIPHLTPTMQFGVQVGDDPETSQSKFERLSGMLKNFTGYTVDDHVNMKGQPIYWNFNVLLDFKPFNDKRWHLTTGLYIGPSTVARAFNTTDAMASLMAVGIYNNLYDKIVASPVLNDPDYFVDNTLGEVLANTDLLSSFDFNGMNNIYLDPDNNPLKTMYQRIANYGRMGIHIGDYKRDIYDSEGNIIHKKGDPYMMEPDNNSMVKAKVKVNSVKPYFGFGYGGQLLKDDDTWRISFDAGMMIWGGTPKIVTHDGTDLANDVEHVGGKVGDYVRTIKAFKVFPLLNLTITKRIF